jgi:hypothetical protein
MGVLQTKWIIKAIWSWTGSIKTHLMYVVIKFINKIFNERAIPHSR